MPDVPDEIGYQLCDTEFFDLNQTWYTQDPQLSACFRNTVLSWIPACVFILAAFNEYASIKQMSWNKTPIPPNWFNRTRLLMVFALIVEAFFMIAYTYATAFQDSGATDPVKFLVTSGSSRMFVISTGLAPMMQLLCYVGLLLIYMAQRSVGRHTSGPVWHYLLISLVCDSIDYYALLTSSTSSAATRLDACHRYFQYAHFPILALLFALECRGDVKLVEPDGENERPTCPEVTASYCSKIVFAWFDSFLIFGHRSRIRLVDLWKTQARDMSSLLVPRFRELWLRKAQRSAKDSPTYRLSDGTIQGESDIMMILIRLHWKSLLFSAFLKLLQDCLQYVSPMILKLILTFLNPKYTFPYWHGILYASLLLISTTVQSLILSNYFHRLQITGLQMRSMIIGSVYRKALVLSGSSRLQSTTGEIVNLMSVDSYRFEDFLLYSNLMWSAPLQILLAMFLLYNQLGWPIFAGVLITVLIVPINTFVANRVKSTQVRAMKVMDERIKHLNELLNGIKVVKLYAWEESFIAKLVDFRNRELRLIREKSIFDALLVFVWNCSPFLVAAITFGVYIKADPNNTLDAEKAFVSITLFNLLRFPLTMLPNLVSSYVMMRISARRLNKFLNRDELIKYVTRNEELEAISIEGGTLTWNNGDDSGDTKPAPAAKSNASGAKKERLKPTLRNIELHVEPRSFVAIVGLVASGKSSLLAAILNEMHRISGRFNVCRSMTMAAVPQQAWIQNMSVRDNILFGSSYDEPRYKRVIECCSLGPDLEMLPGGDEAEIGENGINLSGGQKQRVSLARACYSNSDIILLDDPLSALDSHVAKHVFEQVLSSTTGLLKDRTRVLATNSLFVLPHVDQIVILDGGQVVESGSYQKLMENPEGRLVEFMRQYAATQEDTKKEAKAGALADAKKSFSPTLAEDSKGLESKRAQIVAAAPADLGKLIDVEKIELGSVSFQVYLGYFKAVSTSPICGLIGALIVAQIFNVASNFWLSEWASDADDPQKSADDDLKTVRMLVYAILGSLQCLFILAGSLFLAVGAVRASRTIHSRLLEGILHSPMGFFDITPIGRIVNRFAKDIDVIDFTLPNTFRSSLSCLTLMISALCIICYSFPTFIVLLLPLGVVYYLIQKVFIVTTRQLKRLESATRSPIYSNFSETLTGAATIRAYNCADRFVHYSDSLVDRNLSCSYPNVVANRWLSVRLEFLGNLVTSGVALCSVLYKDSITAGLAGLCISFALNITQTLCWLVRMSSDLETNIVSVERLFEYIGNKREDRWLKEESRPPLDWPQSGAIEIENYSTRYRDDTDLVLSALSISIRPREKIGIVGRTGSGKSSLSLALFRVLEPAAGSIKIDRLPITQYGLHDLRSKLTIIPQDPVLFSGTLRFNLDPLKQAADHEIWRALEMAHLKAHISSLHAGLDHQVSEYGANFSLGQRQLICLARAILRKSRILILDEATASVDLETDSIVQLAIREIFQDCTIITIAHRLHTILDSDRILVLDSGRLRELDTPASLIANADSAFAALVRDAGLDTSNLLSQRRALQHAAPVNAPTA